VKLLLVAGTAVVGGREGRRACFTRTVDFQYSLMVPRKGWAHAFLLVLRGSAVKAGRLVYALGQQDTCCVASLSRGGGGRSMEAPCGGWLDRMERERWEGLLLDLSHFRFLGSFSGLSRRTMRIISRIAAFPRPFLLYLLSLSLLLKIVFLSV